MSDERRERRTAFLEGWRDGAARGGMSDKYKTHRLVVDYEDGFRAGGDARIVASNKANAHYGASESPFRDFFVESLPDCGK